MVINFQEAKNYIKIMLLNIFTYTKNIYKIIFLELEKVSFKQIPINKEIL